MVVAPSPQASSFDKNVLGYGDNLDYLKNIPSNTVDLIYLDPPFNSKQDFNAIFGSEAQIKAFVDTWSWGMDDQKSLRHFAKDHKELGRLLIAFGSLLPPDGLYSYLVFMARRLVEMRRVLKENGSIYLHIDDTACHYLKMILDAIFGLSSYRNQITWVRQLGAKNDSRKSFGRCADTLLWYSKGSSWIYNEQTEPLSEEYADKFYRFTDESGRRFRKSDLSSPSVRPNLTYRYTALNGITYDPPAKGWRYNYESMRKLDEDGLLVYPAKSSGRISQKRFLDDSRGVPIGNVWVDIGCLQRSSSESTGYETQKPLNLLERIILTGSNEGDVVLDPFMGSGTTCVAAAKLNRQFIGLDLTPIAVTTAKARLDQIGVDVEQLEEWGSPQDLDSARVLHESDKSNFDCWALMRCSAWPMKEKDRVVGIRPFMRFDGKGLHRCRALYATALDEPPTVNDVERLKRLMIAKKAEMGLMICFDLPGPQVLELFNKSKQVKLNGDTKKQPSLQIVLVQDVIDQSYLATEVFNHERVSRQQLVAQGDLFAVAN
ncbi:Putative Type II methyltransferase [Synechococcus sp. BIOS-U3-1]|uniref:site-specific DNA-methyltransferase n=1 Tax=Synechococcus sp. BIOS-U3-1 TaxID=1400865 RepID=UPI00164830C2|nr:site-specific DNA-methyltransferase [Synechococcus sp. BIOS-U3-1]QNI58139.1 Putative Type II methyltransferase [Synechococcus sp. BIOS-U3-1]